MASLGLNELSCFHYQSDAVCHPPMGNFDPLYMYHFLHWLIMLSSILPKMVVVTKARVSWLKYGPIEIYRTMLLGNPFLSFLNTFRPWQNGRPFVNNIFEFVFFNGNCYIWIQIPLKFVPRSPVDNKSAFVWIIMPWIGVYHVEMDVIQWTW